MRGRKIRGLTVFVEQDECFLPGGLTGPLEGAGLLLSEPPGTSEQLPNEIATHFQFPTPPIFQTFSIFKTLPH